MVVVAIAAVLSAVQLEGDVAVGGGDYVDVPFTVPAGTVEIQIAHADGSDYVILDWGVWSPDGFRGWGGGLEDDAILGVDQASRGYLPGPIAPGTWSVAIGKAKLDATGGHYALSIVCRDDATLAAEPRAPSTPGLLSSERRWYKGDFHVHSRESGDASATLAEIATLAASRGLDFVNLSDHNTSSQLSLIAAAQPGIADVLFLRGAEITTYSGHANAVGTSAYVDHRLGRDGRTVEGIVRDVTSQGGILVVNHPMLDLGTACIGCAWRHVDDTPWADVAGLELITGNFEIGVNAFVPRAIELWDQLLDQGHRLAAIGGSDDHRAGMDPSSLASPIGSPTTLVLADGLGETAIVDAVRAGRTIVQLRGPDDPRVELTLGTAQLGDTVEGIARASLVVTVTDGEPGMVLQLWRDGAQVARAQVTGARFSTTFDDEPGAGLHRYRVELVSDLNQRLVVTSHLYVDAIAAEGCGCRTARPGAGWPVLLALAAARRRRRVTGASRRSR